MHTILVIFSIFIVNILHAQVVWTGPKVVFTKTGTSDWTKPANQDRITENVWLTRGNNRGLFNIKTESRYTNSSSPLDTEWAFGTTANLSLLNFNNWEDTVNSNPPSSINQDMVLHLISDDIYMDIKFTYWESSSVGGGFSYERSSENELSLTEFVVNKKLKIYPNPASNFIKISGISTHEKYTIYNILGAKVQDGIISNEQNLNLSNLEDGLYALRLNNGFNAKIIINFQN